VDSNVGTLLAALDDLGLRDDTLVIVTSDHGETVSTYPVGHGLHTSNEELRVPFLLSNRKLFKEAHVSERVGNHVDLASTVTAIAGVSPGEEWMGRNLLADRVPSRLLYVMTNHARTDALIDGDLLYSFNNVSGVGELKQAGESEFSPLPPDDPRRSLMSSYRKVAGGLRKWVTWHHLSRAGHLENQS
jgi:membrane-anchored protein YejM (alkaline phosphatase superfamily)